MRKTVLKDLSVYIPEELVTNKEIENKIRIGGKPVTFSLSKIFGVEERYRAAADEQVSDLACKAALPILKRNNCEIDLLIFAAASSDLIEPATGNIVQYKLGLNCPVMDIKNACNSFTTAMQTATAYIQAGIHTNVLVVNGEKISEVVKYDIEATTSFTKYMAGFTLGDAGCAALISAGDGERVFELQKMATWGEHWPLCTIKGGGSMAFRDRDKYYFESDSTKLRDACAQYGANFINECFKESIYDKSEIDVVITHQVSKTMPDFIAEHSEIPIEKWVNTFEMYGNTAAASVPLALNHGLETNIIKKGSKVLLLGFAAGISISFQIIDF